VCWTHSKSDRGRQRERRQQQLLLGLRVGAGTTVELWLPVTWETIKQPEQEPAAEERQTAPKKLVILAVDDDTLVLLNTKVMLEDLGHIVLDARSGAEALEIISRVAHVDLVITDQAMPNMTGLHLASVIKEGWPDLPIVIATGYAEMPHNGDLDLPKISKPYSESDLAKAIGQVMAEKS
jgi:CheY-like chemotaxis protein